MLVAYCAIMANLTWHFYSAKQSSLDSASPLYGVWLVDSFASHSSGGRWERVAFDSSTLLTLQIDGYTHRNTASIDPLKHTLAISDMFDPKFKAIASYRMASPDSMLLRGDVGGEPFTATLRRFDPDGFELDKWHFHLVSQYPH
jgi:hypothetical protein